MPTRVRLFVSAGPDQNPARELLGRALAELPINVGWMIKRTPDYEAVPETHLFLLVMGADITAPVGLELWWALRTEKPVFAYVLGSRRTPAGQVFLQTNAGLTWRYCPDPTAFRNLVLLDIARFLLEHDERYGVSVQEAQRLGAFLTKLTRTKATVLPDDVTGAGGGGVILAPGKDELPGARLVTEK